MRWSIGNARLVFGGPGLVGLMVGLLACRPEAPPPPPEPEPPTPMLPVPASMQPDLTPLDLSPDPLPDGTVAAVDGVPILEAELQRIVADLPPAEQDPEAARTSALVQLVERRLLQAKADQLDIRATEREVEQAIEGVARTNGLTSEQLEQQVADTGWSWEEYREEIIAQLIEYKVLTISGVLRAGTTDEVAAQQRARFVGCLRARAEVQVNDETLVLPENPYERVSKVDALRFEGDLVLPEGELRPVGLEAAKTRLRLCDALTSVELALEEVYLERGYLDADVELPWPEPSEPPVTLEVRVQAGRPHVIGSISFDQSAAPRSKRLDPKELRKRLAGYVAEGDVAAMSAMQAASAEVTRAFQQGGLGSVEATVDRKPRKKDVRVNITYRLLGSET